VDLDSECELFVIINLEIIFKVFRGPTLLIFCKVSIVSIYFGF
jgi:hypothetical protein